MAGKRIVPACIALAILALAFLLLGPGSGVKATNWDTTYTVILSDNAPGANADQTTIYNLTQANNNFAQILSTTGPPEAQIALDSEIPEASAVGMIHNLTTLSIFNGPCMTPVTVDIPFMEGTTDTLNTEPWVGTGDNMVLDHNRDRNEDGSIATEGTTEADCRDGVDDDGDTDVDFDDADCIGNCIDTVDNDADTLVDGDDPDCLDDASDTNGIPTYADHYPEYLNDMFVECKARARYVGHQVVVADAPATILQFVIFNPEALKKCGYAGVPGQLGDTYGFIDFVVLDNPTQATSPSTITDFCAPLTSQPTLYGLSKGQWQVKPGPEPYEVDAAGHCNDGLDQDGDTHPDDGCLYIPDPCGDCNGDTDPDDDGDTVVDEGCDYVRNQNSPAHTGLFGTGTHVVRTYSQSYRDADNDGIANNLDSCPNTPNNNVDADADGLDSACDPNDGSPSPGAPAACTATSGIPDEDQDCFPNRQDNCPLTPNGDPYAPVPSGWDQSDTDTATGAAPADLGPGNDGIGDACDANPNTPDGHYHVALPVAYSCIPDNFGADDTDDNGDADNDDDGVCDSTEDLLGSDKDNAASTPEHLAIDLAIATDTPGEGPGTCTDYTVYDHPDAGPIDNDADTLPNSQDPDCYYDPTRSEDGAGANTCSDGIDNGGEGKTDGDDRDCLDMPTETDDDGVPDSVDNCTVSTDEPQNEEQVDSDGDGVGDECDDDDDNDGFSDYVENQIGTDPKDSCADHGTDAAWPLDFDNDQDADIVDVLKFKPVILKPKTPGGARFDFDADCDIDIVDVLKFKPYILTSCAKTISFTLPVTAIEPVSDIHIEFFAEISHIVSATDNQGGTWTCEKVPPLCANATDDDGDTLVNDGCRPLFGAGENPATDCANAVDDDGDTKVNDGCPKAATDDDGDTVINDGCPKVEHAETACGDGLDNDGDTTVDDGCAAVGPAESGPECVDSEDRYTGGITYTFGSPSYKLNCWRDAGEMAPGGTLTIKLKGKRPPVVRCYDWTTYCVVTNSSSKPCNFHVDVAVADDLYVEFGLDLDGDTQSDGPSISWCDNIAGPWGKIVSLHFPDGIDSAHMSFPPLTYCNTIRAQWWRPGPWTLQCWQWTSGGVPVGLQHGVCLLGP